MTTRQDIIDVMQKKTHGSQFLLNFRGWDYEQILQHGEFAKDDVVLDTGAMYSSFCVYLSDFVLHIAVTDDFSWYTRPFVKEMNLPTIEEWTKFVETFGSGKIMVTSEDVRRIRHRDKTFDKVLSISTIEHIDDDKKGMEEMMRVLKPGGLLLLTTEYRNPKQDFTPENLLRFYDDDGLDTLTKGLHVEERIIEPPHIEKDFTTIFLKIRKD